MACISLPTAAIIGSVASGAAAVGSGVLQAGAAKSAAKTQANAATLAANNQMAQFEQTQANLAPYLDSGKGANAEVENLLGLGGPGGAPDPALIESTLENTPGYKFTLNQGLESVQNSFAAKGLGSSGAALKGAASFATGLADQTYEERLQDYLTTAGRGQSAAAGQGALGQEAAATAGGFSTSGAAATAAGTVGGANALSAALTGLSTNASNGALLSSLNNSGMFAEPSATSGANTTAAGALIGGSSSAAANALNPGG